jgi:nicotinamidase-related amidase
MPDESAERNIAARPESPALLLMDFMVGILSRYEDADQVLSRAARLKEWARESSIPIIYVRIAFRDGHPEVSPRNKLFGAWVKSGRMTEGSEEAEIHPAIAPSYPGDVLVTKRRVSAFSDSDLDCVLRARDIDTLILAGVATSGVVLSTVREAADRDYGLVVVSDCCTDSDQELHQMLLDRLFPRQAQVTDLNSLLATDKEAALHAMTSGATDAR